jgi:predicted anti-sigma-YlaC factor YlaD
MFCDEVLDRIEAIAAGEVAPDGRIADHLGSCADCAAALESARRVERLLKQRAAPRAPAQFTTRTLGRVRRARWRSEQVVDAGFNAAIVLVVSGIVVAIWMLAHRSGLAAVGNDAVDLLGSGVAAFARRVGPSLPLYAGATALVATALGIWWWAERDATW